MCIKLFLNIMKMPILEQVYLLQNCANLNIEKTQSTSLTMYPNTLRFLKLDYKKQFLPEVLIDR